MDQAIWWIGAIHAALYIAAGGIFCATWLMHRTLKWLKLWGFVFEGLREVYRRKKGIPG